MPKTRLAAVGAFVIGGVLLFAVGLFLIGNRHLLFTDTIHVYAEFQRVAALTKGGKVRVAGMDAGEVEEILFPRSPSEKFRVKLRVRKDLNPLLRLDSVASIQNDGLVGNKFVQIQSGTDKSPQLPDGGTIQGREPLDIADLMQMMSDTIQSANQMLVDVKAGVDEALVAVTSTTTDAQKLMNDMGGQVQTILASAQRITGDLTTMIGNVRQGRGTIGKLVTDDELYARVKSMAADAEKAMATVREASLDAKEAIADLRGEKGPLKGFTGDAQQTLRSAREAMADLADTTEALKRNFLFRGFFNRRGFFDLNDVSVADYRRGVLESKDRRALRIWLSASVLFEKDASGSERLTTDGMARLDSAMSSFVRYPPKSPFVVEGYSQEPTGDARYLIGRRRCQLVRDYVASKFNLDSNYVAMMAMGAEADGSPAGKTWDGVALTMFVPVKAL